MSTSAARPAKHVALALRCVLFLSALLISSLAPAQETIYLQSGEQYQCEIDAITGGQVRCTLRDGERAFPAQEVQRIEFQKARMFDGIDAVNDLKKADPLFARGLEPSTEDLKSRYPQAGYVVLSDDLVLRLAADGSYVAERTVAWRILDQRASESSFQAVYFLPGHQNVEVVFGITVGPDGTIARVSDSTMKTEAVYPNFPEYNYQQRLRFTMKNPVPGATLFLRRRTTGKAADLLPLAADHVMWASEPALERTIHVEADDDVLKRAAFISTGGLESSDSLLWRAADTPKIFPEPMMPPTEDFAPRLATAFPAPTWQALAAAFAGRVDSKPLKRPDVATPEDAYRRVTRDVRVVGVPIEAIPVPPAPPETVLARGYGTQVEKALCLEALLDGLGLDASTVLVRRRSAGALVVEAPRITTFTDALVRCAGADGHAIWLEPLPARRAFGELSSNVQGAKGLDLRSGEIVEVPVISAERESMSRTVDVDLQADGAAIVRDTTEFRGNNALSTRQLGDMSEEERRNWASEYVGSTLPGVEVVEFTHSDFEKAGDVEWLKLTYRIPMLAQQSGDFLVLRLPNAQYSPSEVGRTQRLYDLFWEGRALSTTRFTVRAPEGYAAYAVNEGVKTDAEGWTLDSGYSASPEDPRSVVFSETWRREALSAPRDAYDQYRKTLITRGVLRKEMIVFERQPSTAGAQ